MFNLDEFRAGLYGVPFGCLDNLPEHCFRCVYLVHEESAVCFCDAPFYYYCAYSWPDKLTQDVPPCLKDHP